MNFCSDKGKIIKYIENHHLPDGGYFFGGVEPSGGLETCLAVKTLSLLGKKPKNIKSIISFWENQDDNQGFSGLNNFYWMIETWKTLGLLKNFRKKYSKKIKSILPRNLLQLIKEEKKPQDKKFNTAIMSVALRGKGIEQLYRILSLCYDLRIIIPKNDIIKEIFNKQNKNGGFGLKSSSDLFITYYSLKIISLLCGNKPLNKIKSTKNYLLKFKLWIEISYLEDLFCIIDGLDSFGWHPPCVQGVYNFVCLCQRGNGGFGRAPVMSIPTIEDTYYAVKILDNLNKYCIREKIKYKNYDNKSCVFSYRPGI